MSKGRESKPHIGIFGRTNVGKSAFINAITGQDVSIVSPTAGTTTDPVKKSVELTGIGPVILIDTAGIDDTGELGMHRVKRSRAVLNQIDMALLIIAENSVGIAETELIASFKAAGIAYAIIHNKQDAAMRSKHIIMVWFGLVAFQAYQDTPTSQKLGWWSFSYRLYGSFYLLGHVL